MSKHKEQIVESKLKELGFTYKMKIWRKDNFSIQFFRYVWKCSVAGSEERELIYMDDLYKTFWELTGKVLPRLD